MLRDAMSDPAEKAVAMSPESRGGEAVRLIEDPGLLTLAWWDQALARRAQPCSQPSALEKHRARRPSAPPSDRGMERNDLGRTTGHLSVHVGAITTTDR